MVPNTYEKKITFVTRLKRNAVVEHLGKWRNMFRDLTYGVSQLLQCFKVEYLITPQPAPGVSL